MKDRREYFWDLPEAGKIARPVPLTTFLLKIANVCNLDCDYCYVYHSADKSWQEKPKLMSSLVIDQAIARIVEHVKANRIKSISLVLHGGEPLLAGLDTIEYIFRQASEQIDGLCEFELSMQSNGVLLSKEVVNLFAEYDARIGISIDGFKEANMHRILRHGGSSFEKVKEAIDLLNANETGRSVLSGLLAVIDVQTDPLAVYQYLASHNPKSLDFLLPHATHDRYPKGKGSFTESPYADWLIAIFD